MKTAMIYPNDKREQAIHNYSKDLIKETKVPGLTFTRGKPFSFPFFSSLKYKQIHIQHEYNILGWYGTPFLLLLLLYKPFFKKLVLTMHTVISPDNENIGYVRAIFYFIANLIIRMTTNKIIVHSQAFKEILIIDYGFKEKNITVIRHGVKEVPKFDKDEIRKKLGINKNEKVCLLIGTFHRDHQPHVIINQADKIKNKILVVWNSSKGNKAIQYYNESMYYAYMNDLQDYLHTIDLTNEDKDKGMWWEFFYAADLVTLPYIDGIGSGIFQDAIATRTPVVCSSTYYFREMLSDNICGIIATSDHDFPRAIKEAMSNIDKLKQGCEEYANKYSVKNMANKTLEVYNGKN